METSCVFTPSTVVHPSAEVPETEDPRSPMASFAKSVSSMLSERPYLKIYGRKSWGKTQHQPLASTHMYTRECVHSHTCNAYMHAHTLGTFLVPREQKVDYHHKQKCQATVPAGWKKVAGVG